MLVSELIQMLCDNPNELAEELSELRVQLCLERDSLERRIVNLNKVIRIAVDVRTRLDRNNEEIGNLHDELIGPIGTPHTEGSKELDLSNLYILSGTRLKDEDMDTRTNTESAY
jgi:hypothetical protein